MSTIYGNNNSNYLSGNSGNDAIYGLAGNDIILGNGGNDLLVGGSGNDRFFTADNMSFIEKYWGTEGTDTMYGGSGNDSYLVDKYGDQVVEGYNDGNDSVYSALSSYTLPANIENGYLITAGIKDLCGNYLNNKLYGNCFANYICGESGNDMIFGGGYGKDTLNGGAGNDRLYASRRDCVLYGDHDNDVLSSWYGKDTLCGGSGDDRYIGFNKLSEVNEYGNFIGFNRDIIRDYLDSDGYAGKSTHDILDLSNFNLSSLKFSALDTDRDHKVDALYINAGKYGSVEIDKYFDDSSSSVGSSHAGSGCIEDIWLGGDYHLQFDSVQNLLH